MDWKQLAPLLLSLCLAACQAPVLFPPDALLPDGSRYYGGVENGLFEGSGRLEWSNGETYEGDFHQGLMHGHGTLKLQNGSHYTGEFRQGSFSGQGEYIEKDGTRYQGQFVQGELTGPGQYRSADESVQYSGDFKSWRYHGNGKLTTPQYQYTGEFADGYFQGKGIYDSEEGHYDGQFVKGEFTGEGSYRNGNGETYIGQFKNWRFHGDGHLTYSNGDQYKGQFTDGNLEGTGQFIGSDGSSYQGEFNYTRFDGSGQLTLKDGSRYEGEFRYGQYHGEGTLYPAGDDSSGEVLSGIWDYGELVYDNKTQNLRPSQNELALLHQATLLEQQLDALVAGNPEVIEAYFVGVAGDGSQSVFQREITALNQYARHNLGTANRSVLLINDHDTADQIPMATAASLQKSLRRVANKMNPEQDILFLYMTSHGSDDHRFYINHDSLDLPTLPAKTLGNILKGLPIKWKVIVVSACYSGGFIPHLQDENTMVITAASSSRKSFGCSDDADMTYFGRAFIQESLPNAASFSEAFDMAEKLVTRWEDEEEFRNSQPQIWRPQAILDYLKKWRRQLPAQIQVAESTETQR